MSSILLMSYVEVDKSELILTRPYMMYLKELTHDMAEKDVTVTISQSVALNMTLLVIISDDDPNVLRLRYTPEKNVSPQFYGNCFGEKS